MNLPGRRRDHNDGSLLRRLDDSHDDWTVTCGLDMPEMKLMTGIDDRPMTDDDEDVERKRPKEGCPTPWKHCRTWHVSWSWNRFQLRVTCAGPLVLSTSGRLMSGRVLSIVGPVSSFTVRTPRRYGGPTREGWAVPP